MSTSDPQPRKRATKRTTKGTVKKAAKKAPAKKTAAKAQVKAVVDRVDQAVGELIAQRQTEPLLDGSITVTLQLVVDGPVTPTDAVNLAIGQLVDEGLTKWAWIVQGEDRAHVVNEGRWMSDAEMGVVGG